jgi:hypothetical protein
LQKKTRSLLEELDSMLTQRDRENVLESRATHVIQGAINLINSIRESYDTETSLDLERRLLNSIRAQDPSKFNRGVRRLKENKENGEQI